MIQVDGNISDVSSIASSNDTQYETDDEAFAEPRVANLSPVPGQTFTPGQPIIFDVNSYQDSSPNLPLCLLINARSCYNKGNNLTEMLQ